jgi:ankyrin repeat protein
MNFSAAGNATIVKLLLEAGANVNAKSNVRRIRINQ